MVSLSTIPAFLSAISNSFRSPASAAVVLDLTPSQFSFNSSTLKMAPFFLTLVVRFSRLPVLDYNASSCGGFV